MKEVIGKANLSITHYQNILFSVIGIFLIKKNITNSFNEYFVNVGTKLACEIPQSQHHLSCILKALTALFKR